MFYLFKTRPPSRRIQAYRLFFPAASIYAALVIPLTVHAMTSGTGWPAGLIGTGHAYEMLFGFALALIASYLLGPMNQFPLVLLFLLWCAARISSVFYPDSIVALVLTPVFALILSGLLAPKFLAAKKWRNRMISPLIILIGLLPLIQASTRMQGAAITGQQIPIIAIVLLSLLMAFMGGRIIAPAAAGSFYAKGSNLVARVQPRIEAALIILMSIAVIALALPGMNDRAAGLMLSAAGIFALIRLVRWRLWQLSERPDLISLGTGYLWLALGLCAIGATLLAGRPASAVLHLIAIGALGTLSICVMTRIHRQRTKQDMSGGTLLIPAVILIAVATVVRVGVEPGLFQASSWLWTAASCWSLAYILTALQFVPAKRNTLQVKNCTDTPASSGENHA